MNIFRRFSAFSLCILMILALFTNVFSAERSAGEQATYVLNYRVDGDGYEGPDLQYFSPYRIAATLNKQKITMKNCLFSLYNTVNDEVIPVYCSDISVLANPNFSYRRINLEESTFAAGAAAQIRAIVYHGFYLFHVEGESEESHAARVQQELQRLGDAAGVKDLTIGEAITGTQAAIWQAAHGSGLVFTDFLHSMYMTDVSDSVEYYELCDEERHNGHVKYSGIENDNAKLDAASDKKVGGRIQSVYKYLLSVDPLSPTAGLVSAASFREVVGPFSTDNGDGTFDLSVTVTVDVRMDAGDYLNLTASLGDGYEASASLSNGTQTVTLNLRNIPMDKREQMVKLSIEGMQTGFDVYLFDAEGDRESSQAMVGMDPNRLPVYAEISASITETHNDRILNLYKTTGDPGSSDSSDRFPLEGITFDIFHVADLKDYLSGAVSLPEAEEYPYSGISDYTLVTDKEGRASLNFTQAGLPDGVYLVVERTHPAIVAPIDPFYVIMPTTNAEGTGYDYEITVQPKNQVKGFVQIHKDVVSLDNDSASVDAYTDHTWIISATIPEDIANGKAYVISDTLDSRLDYADNMQIRVETLDGQTLLTTLTEGEDYILQLKDVDSTKSFTVELTPVGMNHVGGSITEENFSDYRLRVYYNAQINSNAIMGETIPNEATLQYTNSVSFDFYSKSDKPVVSTGGLKVLKVDAIDPSMVLPGASFELYRPATAEEVAAKIPELTHISGTTEAVVKVTFFDNEALEGEKVTTAISDKNGVASIYGLAYGEYFLLETAAPAGYTPLGEAVKVIIDDSSHTTEKAVTVKNVNGTVLPSTGGPGTKIYQISGFTLLLGAALLLVAIKGKGYH